MENTEVIQQLKDAFELKRQCKYKAAMELLYKALSAYPDNTEILLQVAELHSLLDNKETSVKLYEQLLEKNQGDVNIFGRLAQFYVDTQEYEKVTVLMTNFLLYYPSDKAYEVYLQTLFKMSAYNKIIELYKEKKLAKIGSPVLDKYYGMALCRLKLYGEAKNILGPLISILDADEDVSYFYAVALFETGMVQLAGKILMPVLRYTTNAQVFNLAGEVELDKVHLEKAIDYFSQAVRLKHDGRYYYNLASAYFLKGMLDEAKSFYVKAIAAEPDVLEYRYAHAYLYFEEKNYDKSMQIINEILEEDSDFKEAVVLKAEILAAQNQFFRALKIVEGYTWEDKDTDEAYLRIEFKIYKGLYRYDMAIQSIIKLLRIKNESLDYRYEAACLYFDMAQYENAAKMVLQIIGMNYKYVKAFILAAKIYIKTFDFENAIRMIDRVLLLDVNNIDAYYLKALSFLGQSKFEDAITQAKIMLDYSPDKSEAYALIGAAYFEMKDLESSLRYYSEAASLDQKNADYFLNISLIHLQLGDKKQHMRNLYIAHVLKPDNKEITLRLVEAYINEKKYKSALNLLKGQLVHTYEAAVAEEIKSQIKEVEQLYKKSVSLFKFICWKIFKV